ncbi:MAG: nitroreductase family protein [Spirochaetota bacterium]
MNVHEAIATRKSVRSWADTPVPDDVLERVLASTRLAPSARNAGEWRLVIVQDAELRRRLGEAASNQTFVGEAPVVIVGCSQTDRRLMKCGQPAYLIDASIALDHLTLAAVEEGLGTCWIGSFDPDAVREILGIPKSVEIVELMPLGYPADPAKIENKKRPDEAELYRYDGW